ncbi:MAG: PQQ-binding-like beta-propeller repeat protein, partial [Planctomycetes bacterium]|nr:PQQ-binding-like beta-propeller repeat protein [Planctomycetota bacterium]
VRELPSGQLPYDWSVDIGPGYSGPTVANGRVYVMDRQPKERDATERIHCFESATGKSLWTVEYPAEYRISYTAGPRASVTIHDGKAYCIGAMGHFHCLDAIQGNILWKRDLQKEYEIQMPIWGIAASPFVYRDFVIQQVCGAEGACIVAFDKKTGREAWRALKDRGAYSSPVLIQQEGKDVLVCWTGDSLSGLDPNHGNVYWSHPFPPSRMPIGVGDPVIQGDRLFVSSFYDGSLMVRTPKEKLTLDILWRAVGPDEQHTKSLHAMIGTSIVEGDLVFGTDSYGEFRCLDASTGERIWEDNTAVPRARWATIHMVRESDRVWMFNERGELMITKLSRDGLKILSRSQLIAPTRDQLGQRGGVCWSHPAFAEKSVFARNDQKLVRVSLDAAKYGSATK